MELAGAGAGWNNHAFALAGAMGDAVELMRDFLSIWGFVPVIAALVVALLGYRLFAYLREGVS